MSEKQVVHLTLTGEYAGLSYCGKEYNEKDRFVHANAGHIKNYGSTICQQCFEIWDNSTPDKVRVKVKLAECGFCFKFFWVCPHCKTRNHISHKWSEVECDLCTRVSIAFC